jgi:uncharacterized membrane protein
MGRDEFINYCHLNLKHIVDKEIMDKLDIYEELFDQEENMIAEINKVIRENSFNSDY